MATGRNVKKKTVEIYNFHTEVLIEFANTIVVKALSLMVSL